MTPRGLQIEAPVIKEDGGTMVVVLSSRYVGDFRGPLGIQVEPLYPGQGGGRLEMCQRKTKAPQLVPVKSSAELASLERRKLCILESSAILEGRGRGLKTKSGLPRMWIRSVGEPLRVVEVGPHQVYNWDRSVFEASARPSTQMRTWTLDGPAARHIRPGSEQLDEKREKDEKAISRDPAAAKEKRLECLEYPLEQSTTTDLPSPFSERPRGAS
ncbi:uncharacterized protein PG998_007241 [Apiospora kogelbergensis]|uniref:uncharacterized protein n=1 Tax=Apiospora kogelbergensis TaxID=1337665 RepID=UPI00312DD05F